MTRFRTKPGSASLVKEGRVETRLDLEHGHAENMVCPRLTSLSAFVEPPIQGQLP